MNLPTPDTDRKLSTNFRESVPFSGLTLLAALAIAVLPVVAPAATVAEKPAAKKPRARRKDAK